MDEKMKPILLSFSEKNRDVYKLINDRDADQFKQNTDYICNAIRFYEKNKDKVALNETSIDDSVLEQKVLKVLEKYSSLNLKDLSLGIDNLERASTEETKEDDTLKYIEDNIEDVDIGED